MDKTEKKKLKIVYCSKEKIITNFSSKLTQGKAFTLYQNTIIGIEPDEFNLYKQWYEELLKSKTYKMKWRKI